VSIEPLQPSGSSDPSPRSEALARLCNHLGAREPFVLITGEAGMGKTKLVRDAVARWGARAAVAFVTNPALSRTELLEEIIRRFGVTPPAEATKPQLIACLEQRLTEVVERGQIPVIVVDDAHELDDDLLVELKLLTNATVQADLSLTIVLSGLPKLESRLAEPELVSLRQRIAAQCQVGPLTMPETRRYLQEIAGVAPGDASGPFARKACGEIFRRSGGAPPTIQALAEEAVRRAREAGSGTVTTEHVQAAATALGLGAGSGAESVEPIVEPAPTVVPMAPPVAKTKPAVSEAPAVKLPATPGPKPTPTPKPTTAKQESTPTPRATPAKATPAPSPKPAPVAPPTPEPAKPVDTRPAEVRGREWVERFIGPDEPRFGSLLRIDARAHASTPDAVPATEAPSETRKAAGPTLSARRRGRPALRARGFPLPFRFAFPRSWLMPAAVGVLVLTGAFVLVIVPRRPMPAPTLDASQVAAGASSSARPPGDAPKPKRAASPVGEPRHALDVGSYISSYRAEVERDRLIAETGLQGWVVEDDGDGTHHVVLGIYRSVDRAEISASTLLSRGLISEARVVPVPPKRKRR
jgi:type II secretory pathway predicted ATPase ExeA